MKDHLKRIKQLNKQDKWDEVDNWAFIGIVFLFGVFIGGYFFSLV